MRAMLQNQALAIDQFQNRWQMAGHEAHAFVARTRSGSQDFVRTELGAIERFEDRMQRQYDGELQEHVHALQDECREHVRQEESKLRNELTNALTHESQVCKDHDVLSSQEVAQLRGLVAAQQEELRSIHHDCPELQRQSATTEVELQRKSAHEEHALYQHFDNAIKEKDAQVHTLQHEISRMQEKQRIQLEAERFEAERLAASARVFAEGPSTVRFATPVDKVATVATLHSRDMSLGASAGNMNLKTRTAGQTMVISARRRLGMKTSWRSGSRWSLRSRSTTLHVYDHQQVGEADSEARLTTRRLGVYKWLSHCLHGTRWPYLIGVTLMVKQSETTRSGASPL